MLILVHDLHIALSLRFYFVFSYRVKSFGWFASTCRYIRRWGTADHWRGPHYTGTISLSNVYTQTQLIATCQSSNWKMREIEHFKLQLIFFSCKTLRGFYQCDVRNHLVENKSGEFMITKAWISLSKIEILSSFLFQTYFFED